MTSYVYYLQYDRLYDQSKKFWGLGKLSGFLSASVHNPAASSNYEQGLF
jgi:hypothetical protein